MTTSARLPRPLMKWALLFLGWGCACSLSADALAPLLLPAQTVLWQSADIDQPPMRVTSEAMRVEPLEKRLARHRPPGWVIHTELTLYRFPFDGQDYWAAPGVTLREGRLAISSPSQVWYAWGSGLCVLLGVLLAVGGMRSKRGGWRRAPVLVMALVLFHYAWLSYLRAAYPHTYQSPTDEIDYFQIAEALLHWDFAKPFRYTLGYPIACTPLVALLSAGDPYFLSKVVSGISAYVMMPVCMALAFYLLRRLCESDVCAFSAILAWQLIPKILLASEQPFQGMAISPIVALQSPYIFLAYQYSLCGFNSQSEWASVAALFGCGVLALAGPARPDWAKYVLHGLLFGFACLIRINNIFWAPLLAYLLWLSYTDRLSRRDYLMSMLLLSLAAFGAVFSCQLVANQVQFGNPIVFPYILHGAGMNAGFAPHNLGQATRYYFDICGVPLYLALPALLVMRHRQRRTALILWTVPMLLFFCGFCGRAQHYRFLLPLFYGMTAALVGVEFWRPMSWPQRVLLVLLFAVMVFPCLPFDRGWSLSTLARQWGELPGIYRPRLILFPPLAGLCLWVFRRNPQVLWFMVLCVVLVLTHDPFICLALMVALLSYAAFSVAGEVWQAYRAQREPADAATHDPAGPLLRGPPDPLDPMLGRGATAAGGDMGQEGATYPKAGRTGGKAGAEAPRTGPAAGGAKAGRRR